MPLRNPTPPLHAHEDSALLQTPGFSSIATPHPSGTPAAAVPRHTPPPTMHGKHSTPQVPQTPGAGTLVTACSSAVSAFTTVKVHTAKCSECDKRNMDTMRRCPGCTFQVCKPCCDRRQKAGRTLAHGNMLSPAMATPRAGSGSVVRRRPGSVLPKETSSERMEGGGGEGNGPVKLRLVLKSPGKRAGRQQAKPKDSDTEESSADEFVPDSPTFHKRPRAVPALPSITAPSPTMVLDSGAGSFRHEPRSLSMDQLLQQHGVHTSEKQYREHLMSRHTPVMTNPVIQMPAIVKRLFKPRPSALEIQRNIQNKVRQRLEAQEDLDQDQTVRSFVENMAVTYRQSASLDRDEQDELVSAIREAARRWAVQTYNDMAMGGQTDVIRGLDMCLNSVGPDHRAVLASVVAGCATRKLEELACEGQSRQDLLQAIA